MCCLLLLMVVVVVVVGGGSVGAEELRKLPPVCVKGLPVRPKSLLQRHAVCLVRVLVAVGGLLRVAGRISGCVVGAAEGDRRSVAVQDCGRAVMQDGAQVSWEVD